MLRELLSVGLVLPIGTGAAGHRRKAAWRLMGTLLLAGVASSACMAQSSARRGLVVYEAHCSSCHSTDTNGDGPAHRGVVGRRAGALKDFDYSPALRNSKILWTRATLKAWLTDPEGLIPGQGMDYQLEDAGDREDVVAYLATLKRPARGVEAR